MNDICLSGSEIGIESMDCSLFQCLKDIFSLFGCVYECVCGLMCACGNESVMFF